MSSTPKDIRIFKIVFIAHAFYSALLQFYWYIAWGNKEFEWTAVSIMLYSTAIFINIAFLVRLFDAVYLLKLNDIVKFKPWVFVLGQIILTSKLILPGLAIPIFIWMKSGKLEALESVKTTEERRLLLLPKSKKTWNVVIFLLIAVCIFLFLGKLAGKSPYTQAFRDNLVKSQTEGTRDYIGTHLRISDIRAIVKKQSGGGLQLEVSGKLHNRGNECLSRALSVVHLLDKEGARLDSYERYLPGCATLATRRHIGHFRSL